MPVPHHQVRTAIGGAFLAAIAAVFLLFLSYPYGLIAPDTQEYLTIGQTFLHPQAQISDTARGPGLPLALLLASQTSSPGSVILWMNGILFAFAIAAATWLLILLTGKVWQGLLYALLLLLLEIALTQPFFYILFALTDAPSAFLLFTGTMLVFGGWMQSSRTALFCGFLCLGLSEAFRPMLLIPFFWGLSILWMIYKRRIKGFSVAFLLGCLLILLVPTVSWSVRNALVYDTVRNPYIGAHLLSHAAKLWTEDERIFTDPTVNADFHTLLQTHIVLPQYKGPDLYERPEEPWGSIFLFIASLTPSFQSHREHPEAVTREQYLREFFPIIAQVATQTILRHPGGYLRDVLKEYVLMYHQYSINYLQSFVQYDSKESYKRIWSDPIMNFPLKHLFLHSPEVDSARTSPAVSHFLFSVSWAVRYREQYAFINPGIIVFLHLAPLLGIALFFSSRMRFVCRLTRENGRRIGVFLVLLFLTAAAYHLSIAVLTMLNDVRYAAPGMMMLHLLFILSIGIIIRAATLWSCTFFSGSR